MNKEKSIRYLRNGQTKDYESLSKYVNLLERRIIRLESFLNLPNINGKNESIVGSEYIIEKQNILLLNHIIDIVNDYFGVTTTYWLKKTKKRLVIEIRYLFFWISIFHYNIPEDALMNFLLKHNCKYDRTTFYHVRTKYSDTVDSFDALSKQLIKKYNEIIARL